MKHLLAVVIILITCSFNQPVKNYNPDGQSKLVLYRNKEYVGSAANSKILVNGEEICKLSNNRYIEYSIDPGKIVISAKIGMSKPTILKMETEANKTYYIMVGFKQSLINAKSILTEVTERTAKEDMDGMKIDNCEASK